MKKSDREHIEFLALSCKYGSIDLLHHEIRKYDLRSLGRQSIIHLVRYIKKNQKKIEDIELSDFNAIFPDNQEAAKVAYSEFDIKIRKNYLPVL
jgi:hypothetical protein